MPITGTFNADFSSFQDAVQKAEVSLRSFESGAGKVETSLNRMVDSFSGRKIITDATLMSEAIDRIGGLSKLTEVELARVGTTANEAANKMRAMGVDVPPGLQKIADATKQAAAANEGFSIGLSDVNRLLGAFGIGLSIGAVVQFGREVLAAGDAIQKMADQTGLSLAEVQKLQFIAGQSGTAVGSLVSAIQNLQQRLGDDSSGAAGAIKHLGLNFDNFLKLGPYEQMVTLAEGIKGIEDPTDRASTAAALFGKNWKENLPAILSGMRELGDAAPVMADETVKALDAAGDALDRLKRQSIAVAGQIVLDFEKITAIVKSSQTDFSKINTEIGDGFAGALAKVKPPIQAVNDGLAAFGMTAAEASRIEKELTASVNESIPIHKAAAEAIEQQEKAYAALMSEMRNAEGLAQQKDAAEALARQAKNAEGIWMMERDAWQQTFAEQQKAAAALEAGTKAFESDATNTFRVIGQVADAHRDAGTAAVTATNAAIGGYAALTTQVEMSADAIHAWIDLQKFTDKANAIFRTSPVTSSILLDQVARLPTRAMGGPVTGGQAYVVGERGPELFVPSRGGAILPTGGGTVVNNTFYVNGTGEDIARTVSDYLTRSIMANRKIGSV